MKLQTPQAVQQWLRQQGTRGLVTDSRRVRTGDVFVAWPGLAVDGRAFAQSAMASGAVGVLAQTGAFNGDAQFDDDSQRAFVSYPNLKAAAGAIAAQFYGDPSQQMRVVAFTGTNGKTSSSWWLAQAMDGAVVGTLGIGRIGQVVSTGLTTPDPVLLQAQLKALLEGGCKLISLEASSIGIAEGRLNGTQIHTAVFTNFTQDHLDYHGSMDAYWQAKASLFDWPNLKAAVVNIDDPQGLALVDRLQGKSLDVWTVAIGQPARLAAQNVRTTPTGLAFDVMEVGMVNSANVAGESHHLQTEWVGHYNVSNLLGVIASMRSLGLSLAACINACSRISPVPGRLERVSAAHQPLVLVDYAHTPDALGKVLLTLREAAVQRGGKLWCLFGCGGNRDASKRPLMGAMAANHADCVVLTSDNPRDESPSSIVSQILLGLDEDEQENALQVQTDRALAIAQTIAQLQAVDVLVIAGKGHEDYQEVAGVKSPFSDQAHARAALEMWRAPL